MEIKRGRMVHLGYGKYWRSDEIVGLSPIQEDRGPGRRTEVYVSIREDPMVASRSEGSILRDMVRLPEEAFQAEEARQLLGEILDDLRDLSPVLRRLLSSEGHFEVDALERRIERLLQGEGNGDGEDQEDLFPSRG